MEDFNCGDQVFYFKGNHGKFANFANKDISNGYGIITKIISLGEKTAVDVSDYMIYMIAIPNINAKEGFIKIYAVRDELYKNEDEFISINNKRIKHLKKTI